MNFRSITLCIVASVACGQDRPVLEQLSAQWLGDQFRRYDTNADGKLSADEAKPVTAYVSGADADGDGFITLDELRAHFRNGGGALQQAARKALAAVGDSEIEQRFRQLDKNGDGVLAGEELAGARWLSRLGGAASGVTLEQVKGFFASLKMPEPPRARTEPPPAPRPESSSPREEPRRLAPGDAGIGRMIGDATFSDLDGGKRNLSEFAGGRPAVVALVSPSCPVSKRYLPSLAQFAAEAKSAGASFLLVAPLAAESKADLRAAFAAAKLDAPCAFDADGSLSATLGAGVTTDVLILDAKCTLVYRGALDDQYGLGYSLDAPRHRYAGDALAAVIAGRAPAIPATEAPGCVLDLSKAKPATASVTYHNRISRILQSHCVECHRSGGVAPFALETIEQVGAKAGMVRKMVERQLMPPWFAAPPTKGEHSPWGNDRSLSEGDRADLLAWLSAGRPAGDPGDAPLARAWPQGWQIGAPDAVFQIPDPIEVKATGTMPYQVVTAQTGLAEDHWVSAVEVQPTAREVVHHVLIFVRGAGGALGGRRIAANDESGGFFAAYVPGNDHVIYPDGFAKPLPANATLVFQIHYTPNGAPVREQVKLGVRFAKAAPEHVVHVAGIASHRLNIPPGAPNHPESASLVVPREVVLLGFMPHMHVRGKAFRYELALPGQPARTLLDVPRYDFNWQLAYRYAQPVTIPAGSEIRVTGWFDNSAANPANPDPARTVHWGPQTTDEMMLGYVEYYLPGAEPKIAER